MRTDEGPLSLPGLRIAAGGLVRIRRGFSAAPLIIKILLVAALVFFFPAVVGVLVLAALVYAPFALSACRRSVFASLSVAVWGLAVISGLSGGYRPWLSLLLVLPFAVVAAVHAGSLGRWFVPCRTVAWTLLWAVPVGIVTWRLAKSQPVIGPVAAWVIAGVVLGWRLAKSWQEEREFGRQQARGGALAAPYGWPPSRGPRGGGPVAAGPTTGPRPARPGAGTRAGRGTQPGRGAGPGRARRARARPAAGPAGGCARRAAPRADLVGEYLGATAIKTNELIDSALGGVLFIDEAYSLANEGDGQGDRFGSEAVQALLTRAEDDRDDLIIILAGYERQMENFLASNPGLTSRFAVRVKFPGYTPAELLSLADLTIERRGERLGPRPRPVLSRVVGDVGRRKMAG